MLMMSVKAPVGGLRNDLDVFSQPCCDQRPGPGLGLAPGTLAPGAGSQQRVMARTSLAPLASSSGPLLCFSFLLLPQLPGPEMGAGCGYNSAGS